MSIVRKTSGASVYAKLDGSNQPFTGDLAIGVPEAQNNRLEVADGAVGGVTYIAISNQNINQFLKLGINADVAQIGYDNADTFVIGEFSDTSDDVINPRLSIDAVGAGSIVGTWNVASTLTLGSGSITDSTGTIDFGNENLSTTGTITGGEARILMDGATPTVSTDYIVPTVTIVDHRTPNLATPFLPATLTIETLPSVTAGIGQATVTNANAVAFNSSKLYADENVTLNPSGGAGAFVCRFTTDLTTLDITRTITDIVFISGSTSSDGMYIIALLTGTDAWLYTLAGVPAAFPADDAAHAQLISTKVIIDGATNAAQGTAEFYSGYTNTYTTLNVQAGNPSGEPIIDFRARNSAFTSALLHLDHGGVAGSFDIDGTNSAWTVNNEGVGTFFQLNLTPDDDPYDETRGGLRYDSDDNHLWYRNDVEWVIIDNFWQRVGTTISPITAGDTISDGTFSITDGVASGLVSLTDGTASWVTSSLSGFTSIGGTTITGTTITGTTITDSTASLVGGSLTGVKLGTLTDTGFVKTSGGDGTLSVDTTTYLSTTDAATTYLKLDTSNDPLTGDLEISKATPKFTLTDTGDSEYATISRTDTNTVFSVVNRVSVLAPNEYSAVLVTANTDNINFGNVAALDSPASMTINMWVKTTIGAYQGLITKRTSGGWVSAIADNGKLYWYGSGGASFSTGTVPNNTAAMVTFVYDGTNIDFYINGSPSGTAVNGCPASGSDLKFGEWAGLYYFGGSVDEIGVWNTELSAAQILALYNGGNGTIGNITQSPFSANFILGCHCDEGTGLSVADFSGNGNNGTGDGIEWGNPLITSNPTIASAEIIKSTGGVASSEEGIATFGHESGRTIIDGDTINFNIGGVEVGGIDASGNLYIDSDTAGLQLGADQDATIYSDTANEISLKGSSGATADVKLVFEGGNEGYIQWQEDETQFYIGGGGLEVSGWLNMGGAFFPRQVTDAGPMTATDGTEGEIVYNLSDNKFYGCTATGTPATWAAFN